MLFLKYTCCNGAAPTSFTLCDMFIATLSVWMSFCLFSLNVCLFVCLNIYLSVCFIPACLFWYLSFCPFIYLFRYLSVCLLSYLSVCLYVSVKRYSIKLSVSTFLSKSRALFFNPCSFFLLLKKSFSMTVEFRYIECFNVSTNFNHYYCI